MVVALAGRRIDAPDAETERFPARNVDLVRDRVRAALAQRANALVCSAACGADLIALEETGKLGFRRRVVLPFSREVFKKTSVVDRPGDWGAVFDGVMDELERASDLVVLPYDPTDKDAYTAANSAILAEAERLSSAAGDEVGAFIVWDGKPRGYDDTTAAFRDSARQKGYPVYEILTTGDQQ